MQNHLSVEKITVIPEYLFQIPKGFFIKKGKTGYGIFTAKDITAGDILYDGDSVILPYTESERIIRFKTAACEEDIVHQVNIHAIPYEGNWQYFGFDSIINHSCLANVFNIVTTATKYRAIALRNIKAGDELFFDYKLLAFSADDIDCHCQAPNCLGKIYGFNDLAPKTKNALFPYAFKVWQSHI